MNILAISLGHLEYRSVRFETEVLDMPNYQGNAAVNYTDEKESLYKNNRTQMV